MIIFLPCYKRLSILEIILKSINNSNFKNINERVLLLIHNNNPNGRIKIEELVKRNIKNKIFSIKIFNRKKSFSPATLGWFNCIEKYIEEDESLVFLGDDDLLLPYGIINRFRQITENQADILVSKYISRAFFFNGGKSFISSFKEMDIKNQDFEVLKWDPGILDHNDTTFISSICFRYTEKFRKALLLSIDLCSKEDWGFKNKHLSYGLLISFLPYLVDYLGGKVLYSNEFTVVRGAILEETANSSYADGGSILIYSLIGFYHINNLKKIDSKYEKYEKIQTIYLRSIQKRIIQIFFIRHIPIKKIFSLLHDCKLSLNDLITYRIFNFSTIKETIPFLSTLGLKIRKRFKINNYETHEFLKKLSKIQQ